MCVSVCIVSRLNKFQLLQTDLWTGVIIETVLLVSHQYRYLKVQSVQSQPATSHLGSHAQFQLRHLISESGTYHRFTEVGVLGVINCEIVVSWCAAMKFWKPTV